MKDPFMVELFARHKDMKSTGKYIHYAVVYQHSGKDEWNVKAAKTVQEATDDLISAGFEYVTDIEGLKLFRKRK